MNMNADMNAELFPSTLPVVCTVSRLDGGPAWLAKLPAIVDDLRERWNLTLGKPFHGGSCSWVAPVRLSDGGESVLKVNWPNRESAGEAEALRLWDGRGAVRLLREDHGQYALLIERCDPGDLLADADHIPAHDRLLVGARLLNELWSAPVPTPGETALEDLADVTAEWADLLDERMERHKADLADRLDPGLAAQAAHLLRDLPRTARRRVVVHGDFNPGNILAARRRPWLAIDAKPMIGDPAYDLSRLLLQIDDPFNHADPRAVLAERYTLIADVIGEDTARLTAWALAREVESALSAVDTGDTRAADTTLATIPVLADVAKL